jgi:hypothetical protein
MKRILIILATPLFVIVCVIAYLALIGMNDKIEAASTGNIVKFSSAALAAQATQLSSAFSPAANVTVRMDGVFSAVGGLEPDELNLKVEMTGHHRRRLFDPSEYFVCSEAEMNEQIRTELVKLTGDKDLMIKSLSLGHLRAN